MSDVAQAGPLDLRTTVIGAKSAFAAQQGRTLVNRYSCVDRRPWSVARWSLVQLMSSNCHSSYSGVCISPPSPDLDCGYVSFRRWTMLLWGTGITVTVLDETDHRKPDVIL